MAAAASDTLQWGTKTAIGLHEAEGYKGMLSSCHEWGEEYLM